MRTNIIERQDAGQSTAAPGPRTPVPVNIGRGRAKYGTARWQYNVFLCLIHPFFKALVQFIKTQMLVIYMTIAYNIASTQDSP